VERLGRRIVVAIALGALCYVALTFYADWTKVGARLAGLHKPAILFALVLAALNYLVRFGKWHYYLACLGVRVPLGESFRIFISGFVLTVTPGKVGEVLKSYLLRELRGIPMTRTAPIIVAERLTDLMALALLAVGGVATYGAGLIGLGAAVGLVGLFLIVIAWRRLAHAVLRGLARLPLLGRASKPLHDAYESMAALVRPRPLVVATALSVAAWFCECLAFAAVVRGFPGAAISLHAATFIYASMTIAGALSFLPGGLGVTEAGMTGLLLKLGQGVDAAVAVGATFVTRGCTLWFAVLVGFLALLSLRPLQQAVPPRPAGEP